MLGLGAISIICTAPADYCAVMESSVLDAVNWWAAIEPRSGLTVTLDAPKGDVAWAFTVELTDYRSHAHPDQGRICIKRGTPGHYMPRVIAHELAHLFRAADQYPECNQGFTIMCTTLAWFWPNPVSDETRELIGWHWPVHRVYLPQLR